MKNFKRLLCLVLTVVFCFGLCACGANITIPDVEKLDVDTAKTLLAGKGLIPKVEYEYSNDYDYDLVIRTEPSIGSKVSEDTPVTLYVCKGPSYYTLPDSVGRMWDVEGIEPFKWSANYDGTETKGFYSLYVEEGYLHIPMYLKCVSKYNLEFYDDFGTASINDTFDKTVPIKIIYDSKTVDNKGGKTSFTAKIPLSDLGVQKPTNINLRFDFLVDRERETFQAGFDLTW